MTRAGTSTRAIVVALLAALAVGAAAATARAATPPAAGAKIASCRTSPLLAQRTVVAAAWMRPLSNARHLALKLDLQQRQLSGGRWTLRSDVPGLSVWTTPSDALLGSRAGDLFKYRQAVGQLVVPAAYRFRVSFRWLDDAGAVVRESAVMTRACRQPDLRPNLVLGALTTRPTTGPENVVRWSMTVTNEGHSTVRGAVVAATFPGEETSLTHQRTVGRLAPGASLTVVFAGPACSPGATPAGFAADPANVVEESDEGDNQLVVSCPPA